MPPKIASSYNVASISTRILPVLTLDHTLPLLNIPLEQLEKLFALDDHLRVR
jgi:hypothetical protein